MTVLVGILFGGYLLYLLWEKRANDRALKSFQHIIHVNGIRGKTSVCRMIDAHLRGAGYRVFTKTTGSTPCYIDVSGQEHLIRRRGPAHIGEQLAMIRKAAGQHAEILILECMAVQPELQRVAQERIVQGDLNVITNVRYDHIFEMGESLEEIAGSISGTIPQNGILFTADETFFPYFQAVCQDKESEAVLCRPSREAPGENEAIACTVGAYLGIPSEKFPRHMAAYQEDFGGQKLYWKEGTVFLNLFSANDPQSTRMLLERHFPDSGGVTLLYNNRTDRPDRLLLFIRRFFHEVPYSRLLIMGESRSLALRTLRRSDIAAEGVSSWREAVAKAGHAPLVGIGNIKGQAYEMIQYFEEGGEHE